MNIQVKPLVIGKLTASQIISGILSGINDTVKFINDGISLFVKRLLRNKSASNNISGVGERRNKFRFFQKFPVKKLFLLVVVGVVLYGGYKIATNVGGETSDSEGKIKVQKATSSQDLNKVLFFPLKNGDEEISKIKYEIEKAELKDEIIVKGKRARAVEGRTFLIITLKITNEYSQQIDIKSRDYVRLSVNDSDEWLAPEIHNDPVEVQAMSTKYTRLGFPINVSDKDLALRVGEINGEKEIIPLEL